MYRMLSLLFLLLILAGCSLFLSYGPTTRVRPSTAGMELNLDDLVASRSAYSIFYSGPVYNPSAVLFVPKGNLRFLAMGMGWERVEDRKQLNNHLTSMKNIDVSIVDPALWAIVPFKRQDVASEDVLAYIFTPGYASVQKLEEKGRYKILPVPEQFNPTYHDMDRDKGGIDGGF